MRMAKSIDELYEEVKDFDMVLCNDAPLATALNNRIQKPFIGNFAVTPRQLAGDLGSDILKGPVLDDIDIVREVTKDIDNERYTLRFVHGEIENIKRIRRFKKDVPKYLGKRSKKVYDSYIRFNTTDKAMENFDSDNNPVYKGKKVAVIGTELFDDLDKYVNPHVGTFEEISIFKRGNYIIPEIRELSNNREIAENVASLITEDNCNDVAIVMDVGGQISAAMKSALYKHKIPFINKLTVRDLDQTRDFLEFLNLSLSFNIMRLGQIREIVSNYGGFINPKYDNYLAKGFDIGINDETKTIIETMENICEYTYDEVRKKIVSATKRGQIKLLLEEVGILNEKITRELTDDLIYAVNNINDLKHNEQIPPEEKGGVLLVDCLNSVYIDRPVVFFLGLGDEWEKDVSFLNDIDYKLKDDEIDRNVDRFQVLLQQGSKRIYVVNSIKDGKIATPCEYFVQSNPDCLCEKFSDVCEKITVGPWIDDGELTDPIKRGSVGTDDEHSEIEFSSSSYNLFFSCPRAFMFSRLLGEPDNENTITGNYLHYYAEFRLSYPDRAKEHDVEYYVDFISDRCLNLYSPESRILERSALRVSITNIDWYVDNLGIVPTFDDVKLREVKEKKMKEKGEYNPFIGPLEFSSDQTEIDLGVPDKYITGKIDVLGNDFILDYKTGGPHDAKHHVENLSKTTITDYAHNFQPLFYFHMASSLKSKEFGEFRFFYTNGNVNEFCKGKKVPEYIKDNIVTVYLIDDTMDYFRNRYINYLFSIPKFTEFEGCKESLMAVVEETGLKQPEILYNNKTLAKQVDLDSKNAISLLNNIRKDFKKINLNLEKNSAFASPDKREAYVTRENLSSFIGDIEKAREAYKSYYETEFPATPKMRCEKCSYRDICTATVIQGGDEDVEDE